MQEFYGILLLALLIDYYIGDPNFIWRRMYHPVAIFGFFIHFLEKKLNKQAYSALWQRIFGGVTILGLIFLTFIICWWLDWFLQYFGVIGFIVKALIASIFFAQKSLIDHVFAVSHAFKKSDLQAARTAVSLIVGRDTKELDESAISRAAIESLAENSSDGVIAPIFWYCLLGFPGLACYKLLNTADSMIGHKNKRYVYFGYASARLDDLANYIPARLNAFLVAFTLFVFNGKEKAFYALKVVWNDAGYHRSPNAGWPECAYAGGLNIQLAGPRIYNGHRHEEPMQNANGNPPQSKDIDLAIILFKKSMFIMMMLVFIIFLLFVFLA